VLLISKGSLHVSYKQVTNEQNNTVLHTWLYLINNTRQNANKSYVTYHSDTVTFQLLEIFPGPAYEEYSVHKPQN